MEGKELSIKALLKFNANYEVYYYSLFPKSFQGQKNVHFMATLTLRK